MGERNHPLFVGEVVYDNEMNLIGEIVSIKDGKVKINQGKFTDFNRANFDEEAEKDADEWFANENDVYQIVKGKVDSRQWGFVCYEHNDIGDGYPYYSPILDENLYEFEVMEIGEKIFINDLWDLIMGNTAFMNGEVFRDRYVTDDNTFVSDDSKRITIGEYKITVEKI